MDETRQEKELTPEERARRRSEKDRRHHLKIKFRGYSSKEQPKGAARMFSSREQLREYMGTLGMKGGRSNSAEHMAKAGRVGGRQTKRTYGRAYYRAIRYHGSDWREHIHKYDTDEE